MKTIDGIKPKSKTEYGLFMDWLNRIESELRSMPGYGHKINIKYYPKIDDKDGPPNSRGRATCGCNGEHSWFSYAMDHAL